MKLSLLSAILSLGVVLAARADRPAPSPVAPLPVAAACGALSPQLRHTLATLAPVPLPRATPGCARMLSTTVFERPHSALRT